MLEPINATSNIFLKMFAGIAAMFSVFLTYIRYLYEWLLSLFEEMMIILQRIAMENSIIFSKINNCNNYFSFSILFFFENELRLLKRQRQAKRE